MGLRLNVDLETNQGPSSEVYIRIDNWKINKTTNDIVFTTTSWLDKSFADAFLRTYYDEPLKNSIGLLSPKVVYYKDDKSDGEEIVIDNLHKLPMVVEKEIEIPQYSIKKVNKEVPYVSFDENGDEITLYRTVTSDEEIQSGVIKEVKQVVDYGVISRLGEFCYDALKEHLGQYFPIDKIEKL